MGRRVARVKEPGAATTVTPRHSRRSGAVDPSTLLFLPLTTQPAGGRDDAPALLPQTVLSLSICYLAP